MSKSQNIVIACGVESMTNVPMGLPITLPYKNGFGKPFTDDVLSRYKVKDFSQFVGAEMMAKKFDISREEMDEYSLTSHQFAIDATNRGAFKQEILPLSTQVYNPKTKELTLYDTIHSTDEGIRFDVTLDALSNVKPIQEDGLITAASASQICDGASAMMIVNEEGLKSLPSDVKPIARIHHMSMFASDPVIMLDAPLEGTMRALKKCNMSIDDIDLFEINEAFASVPLAWLKYTGADRNKLNIHGGAIALGHPLGASGTQIMTTLVHALQQKQKKWGLQSMCEGGGMANVTIIENLLL